MDKDKLEKKAPGQATKANYEDNVIGRNKAAMLGSYSPFSPPSLGQSPPVPPVTSSCDTARLPLQPTNHNNMIASQAEIVHLQQRLQESMRKEQEAEDRIKAEKILAEKRIHKHNRMH